MENGWQMEPPESSEPERGREPLRNSRNDDLRNSRNDDLRNSRNDDLRNSRNEDLPDSRNEDLRKSRNGGSRKSRKGVVLFLVALGALVIAALVGAGILTLVRHKREAREAEARREQAGRGPRVLVAKVQASPGVREVTLPGDVRAYLVVQLTAKVNGYVDELRVDKGDRVKKGEVLARIGSPETDQLERSARSTLRATRRLAKRARVLAPAGVMTQQELDNARAGLGVAQAEVRRTRALKEYETVRAPFDGVVTQRYVDPGALVSGTAQQPLVEVSDATLLRVFVYAGQDIAPFLRVGDEAAIAFPQIPGLKLPARVTRVSGALDPRTRSMLVELQLANTEHLLPGLFAEVTLRVAVPRLPVVPADALVARGEKLLAPVVQNNRVHFVAVQPGTNDGQTVEIRRGLRGGEVVALAVPSELAEGAVVQPVTPEEQKREEQQQQRQQQPAARRGQNQKR